MASTLVHLPAELRTERLRLRRWRALDAEPLARIYGRREYLEHMPALDLEQTRAQVARFERDWRVEGFAPWAVEDLASGRLIGRVGLQRHHDWPLAASPVEVGWGLDPDYWGRGLATEAGRAALGCWRDLLLNDRRLISITTSANARSRAVMLRLGLRLMGTARWRGYDVVWHAIERPQ